MRITTGKVVQGRIELEGDPLDDGEIVTVLSHDSGEAFELSAEAEDDLLASIAEADRGELLTREQVFAMLQYSGD
jgi:hypothetical protein